jgi:prevent-host-death family protein
MSQVTLEEASTRLSELIEEVEAGQEVILMRDNLPVAKLVAAVPTPCETRRGSMKGRLLYMAPDFDATPEDFQEYLNENPSR